MAPSKEAIKRAEEYITIEGAGDSTELMIGKYVFKTDKNVRIRGEADLIQLIVATAIDDHTADLRAEVEALRVQAAEIVRALELEQQSVAEQGKGVDNYITRLVWQTREETYKRAIEIIKSR